MQMQAFAAVRDEFVAVLLAGPKRDAVRQASALADAGDRGPPEAHRRDGLGPGWVEKPHGTISTSLGWVNLLQSQDVRVVDHGLTPEEMGKVRPRLDAFAAEMFAELPRSDQRAKGELYVRGLMLDGQRKSMQPMAERLGVDHQQLQQFVSSSTWDHTQVRARLARWAQDVVEPDAHVIDDVGFAKDGLDCPSPGIRLPSPTRRWPSWSPAAGPRSGSCRSCPAPHNHKRRSRNAELINSPLRRGSPLDQGAEPIPDSHTAAIDCREQWPADRRKR
jgi:hypothetical protein